MAVQIESAGDSVTAYLSGEIDHHSVKSMREAIDQAAQQNVPRVLILDFDGVTFMDSSGVGLIMGRYRLMEELGGALRVTRIPDGLRRVMELSGLGRLGVLPTREEASPASAERGDIL